MLWGDCPKERLVAASALGDTETSTLQEVLVRDCPVAPWPYGMPTAGNPYVVVLGMSPGTSPAQGDADYFRRPAIELPTFGTAHPRWDYNDPRGYWDKVRLLTSSVISAIDADVPERSTSALSGHMNLSTGASGQADKVALDPVLAAWVATTISTCLRPRYVIGLGLWSALRKPEVRSALTALGSGKVDYSRPMRITSFRGYQEKTLLFREWDLIRPDGGSMTFVCWPQHPSRAPFSNRKIWAECVAEYCSRIARPRSPAHPTLSQARNPQLAYRMGDTA